MTSHFIADASRPAFFDGYEFTADNYKKSRWKLTRDFMVYSENTDIQI
jgi:hypothetical protein